VTSYRYLIFVGSCLVFTVAWVVFGPTLFATSYEASANRALSNTQSNETAKTTDEEFIDTRPVVQHVPQPTAVKAIYMSACVAGTPSFRSDLVALAKRTEINSIVIDIKDYSGTISFPPQAARWQPAWAAATCGARDMKDFIAGLHEEGIYVIGRITVFQDPFAAVQSPHLAVKRADGVTTWHDGKGLSFIDVAAKEHWDHIVSLAVDAYTIGFDELNFDYVRYPSDGNMADISFPHTAGSEWPHDKQANLEAFFRYLNHELDDVAKFQAVRHENTGRASSTPYTSADLFGMTTTNYDDLSIGQVQERAAPYFDAIAPMVYPSHYPKSFLGLGNPNDYPYQVVYYAMKSGVDRVLSSTTPMAGFLHARLGTSTPPLYSKPTFDGARLRTWIQDFDYGGDYDAADVRAQIQASYDAGVDSWMIWAPSNRYTEAALLTE
jgi:hypothetical protein